MPPSQIHLHAPQSYTSTIIILYLILVKPSPNFLGNSLLRQITLLEGQPAHTQERKMNGRGRKMQVIERELVKLGHIMMLWLTFRQTSGCFLRREAAARQTVAIYTSWKKFSRCIPL